MATKDKYDRQLRLWGPSGQRALAQSTIVLFNATAAGTETLKNLVLPGVGSFLIVDESNALVPSTSSKKPEVFSNFFVFDNDEEAEGGNGEKKRKTRAEVACQHLMELNPDVKGSSQSVSSFDETDYQGLLLSIAEDANKDEAEEFFGKVVVIAADLPPKPLLSLSAACWDADIALVIVKSYGLIGSVRLQLNHHPIIQSRPDSEVPDLRLAEDTIFPSLQNLVDEVSLEKLDDKEHAHVPSVILLIKAMKQWKEKTQKTTLPKTLAEKNEYRDVIKSMSRNFQDELNFEEAHKDAYLAYTKKEIPFEVQSLVDEIAKKPVLDLFGNDVEGKKKHLDNIKFDLLLFALSKLLKENNGQPPVNGSIPDMTASTDLFIKLQEAYKTKALEDVQSMRTIVDSIVEEYRSSSSDSGAGSLPKISEEDIVLFCKNVFNLQLLKTRPFHEEYQSQTRSTSSSESNANEAMETTINEEIKEDLMMVTMDPYEQMEHTPLLWHIALRACDKFHETHNVYPGSDGRELSLLSDAKEVQTYIKDIVVNLGLEDTDFMKETLLRTGSEEEENKHAKEMVRYFNAEVHNVGSVLGGVASQEVVKIITGQYVPLNDTYIYNGIAGVAGVYRL